MILSGPTRAPLPIVLVLCQSVHGEIKQLLQILLQIHAQRSWSGLNRQDRFSDEGGLLANVSI